MWSASIPYSTHVPGSSSRSSRSRTVSLPSDRCRSTNCSPPMPSARSRRAARSPTSGPQSCTFPPPADFARSAIRTPPSPSGRSGPADPTLRRRWTHTLTGRVALVTGVSRRGGIGFAIARRLLADGASVFVHSWAPHDAEHPWGADPDGVDALVAALGPTDRVGAPRGRLPRSRTRRPRWSRAAIERFGALDVVVANHARSSHAVAGGPHRRGARRRVGRERARVAAARPGVRRRARRHATRRTRGAVHLGPAPRADGRRAPLRGEQGRDPPDDAQPRRPPRRPAASP